jgi:hypothetical protein
MVYPSRKPEPYLKATCKECTASLEFLPASGVKNIKVEVECWSCHAILTLEIDATGTKIKPPMSKATSKWSRKRGTGKLCHYIPETLVLILLRF